MSTQLGENQQAVLRCLRQHGKYRRGGAWIWDNWSGTERILDSLVKRGLVEVTEENTRPATMAPRFAKTYRLTPAGSAAIIERTR